MDLTAAALGTLYLDQFLVLVYAAHTIQSIGLCLTHRKASLSRSLLHRRKKSSYYKESVTRYPTSMLRHSGTHTASHTIIVWAREV